MKLLTIKDEIKDIDDRIEKSISELYEKAVNYRTEQSKYSAITGIIIGSVFLLGFGSILLSLPIRVITTTALCTCIAVTLFGAVLVGAGIAVVVNSKKNANKVLSKDELYPYVKYIVERGCNIEIKEMYERVEKLLNTRNYLMNDKNNRENGVVVEQTSIAPLRPNNEPIKERKGEKIRRR